MRKNLLLIFLSLIFSLGACEGGLRILDRPPQTAPQTPKTNWATVPERVWTEYHPELGWYHQKNKRARIQTDFVNVEIQTNSAGFRGAREYSLEKKPGVKRVLALGDSFVFGFGVAEGENFSQRLEAADPQTEVLNLGVPGYGIDQMLMAYRSMGKSYHADTVLIGLFPEDFWRNLRAFADTGHAKPYFEVKADGKLELKNVPVPPQFKLNMNQFPDLIEHGALENVLYHSELYKRLKKAWLRAGIGLGLLDPDLSEEWILGRAILSQLIREVREDGSEPVMMMIPSESWARSTRKTTLRKSLIKFAEREKAAFVDLTPVFNQKVQEEGIAKYYIEGDWHWTAKGHKLAAEAIRSFFENGKT